MSEHPADEFCRLTGAEVPLICGAMYPCSNPELVGAVAAAGAMAIVQPLSLIYVHGRDFREGIQEIKTLSGGRPFGFNAIIEKSAKSYENRMRSWIDIALEEGVRFFVTALGNPDWAVEKVHAAGGIVFHDVTELKWAQKAKDAGVDGLICVNGRAGGHAGTKSPQELFDTLSPLGLPLVAAGGVGDEVRYVETMSIGYGAVQMGTRFIATNECKVHQDYWDAILRAEESDIVLTERLSGVPVSVINTPLVQKVGTKAGPIARRLLKGRRTKHWMRTIYALKSLRELKHSIKKGVSYSDVWQAGKSVGGIHGVEPAAAVVKRFDAAWKAARAPEESPR
ncbi:Nitronate monooxygenase [Planctomycetes bacterium Poly30]|uniref:Nitronate monooxygenase n=1 Tax=Saltatorellus ferox TaxID=2528018 RepID=A0A518ENB4_9BACT|nr:Nitronate monooxygenase [Planctomycetes bacterium Poly30]